MDIVHKNFTRLKNCQQNLRNKIFDQGLAVAVNGTGLLKIRTPCMLLLFRV